MSSPFTPSYDGGTTTDLRPTALQVLHTKNAISSLPGHSIVITGCTSGLGITTAAALYETGASLFLTARDTTKLEAIIDDIVRSSPAYGAKAVADEASPKLPPPPRPVGVELRLHSLVSVRAAAASIKQRTNKLYALVNNAGIMATPYGVTEDGFESQLGTNHLGHFALFLELKALLLAGAAEGPRRARVVNVTSAAHISSGIRFEDMHFASGEYDKWAAYGQSKTANIYMANSITRHFGGTGLIGLSVHLGMIATNVGRYCEQADFEMLESKGLFKHMMSVEQGAATTVWAVVSAWFGEVDVDVDGEVKGMYLADVEVSEKHAVHAFDEEKEERLWVVSCRDVGVDLEASLEA